ncbi:MAG: transcription-repair coupling factor, partial [Chitinophagaceae bacterium]|nr:transcription-repair coupling factor [Chitinophagaceae bacterium]
MSEAVLTNFYLNDPRIYKIADRIVLSQSQKIHLKGLAGSSSQFIVNGVFKHPVASQVNHLVILKDAEEAAYFHNTLESISNALNIFYFPSSFKNKKNYRLLNSSHVMLRTECLTKFSNPLSINRTGIIITYPEALFEKVVLSKILAANIISLKQGETIDVDNMLEKFVGYGFERTDFVYEPGQFAIRGGIIDIYSFGNEKPYRVELFGNEIDSIRIFDPENQLSERKLLQVNIIPNVETQFDDGEKVSLLNFLPDNTAVWMEDWEFIKEKLEQQEDDLEIFFEVEKLNTLPGTKNRQHEDDELNEKIKVNANDFVTASVFEDQVNERHVIEFGNKSYFGKQAQGNLTETFNTKPQPAFNRQFNLLIQNLKELEQKKYDIYLFADNPKQLERLHSIFADLKAEIQFTPIPVSIHHGFIDDDLKLVCYTDHQIFQRYHKYKVKQAFSKNKALTLKTLRELQPGDFVTHIDHGVGVYSGLQKLDVNGRMQEAVRIVYKDSDLLYVNISSLHKISKYSGKEGT